VDENKLCNNGAKTVVQWNVRIIDSVIRRNSLLLLINLIFRPEIIEKKSFFFKVREFFADTYPAGFTYRQEDFAGRYIEWINGVMEW
jgi:hypothetical protein